MEDAEQKPAESVAPKRQANTASGRCAAPSRAHVKIRTAHLHAAAGHANGTSGLQTVEEVLLNRVVIEGACREGPSKQMSWSIGLGCGRSFSGVGASATLQSGPHKQHNRSKTGAAATHARAAHRGRLPSPPQQLCRHRAGAVAPPACLSWQPSLPQAFRRPHPAATPPTVNVHRPDARPVHAALLQQLLGEQLALRGGAGARARRGAL